MVRTKRTRGTGMSDLNPNRLTTTLNVNGLITPAKRQRFTRRIILETNGYLMSFKGITQLQRAPVHPAVPAPQPPAPGKSSFGSILVGLPEPPAVAAVMGRKTPVSGRR